MNEEGRDLFYLNIQEECLKNAEQFIKDAQLLRSKNSLGHAYSLAVLGLEEIARFWIIFFIYMNFYTEDSIEVELANTKHVFKQRFAWSIFSSLIIIVWLETSEYKEEIAILVEELNAGKISYEAYEKKFNRLLKEESQKSPSASNVLRLEKEIKKLNADYQIVEKKRKRGLYVEYDISEKQIKSTPDSFIREDVKFIDTVQVFSDYVRDVFNAMKTNLHRKEFMSNLLEIRQFAEGIRKIIDEIDEKELMN